MDRIENFIYCLENKVRNRENLTNSESLFIGKLCLEHEVEIISRIRERQKSIPGIILDNFGYNSRWGGDLSPGCKYCMNGEIRTIRSSTECNMNCKFCYYYGKKEYILPEHFKVTKIGGSTFTLEDMKILVEEQGKGIPCFSWVWYEPILVFEKIIPLISHISSLGKYQYIYTNGTLVTENKLKTLRDSGLDEIRFNLAATNCSDDIIKVVSMATKYIKNVCIESPMYSDFFNSFIQKKNKILDTGFSYLNLAELHLNDNNINNFQEDIYILKYGYVSPISSRRLTYDLMEIASTEKWNIVINDCSNERKWFRGVKSSTIFGLVDYYSEMPIPLLKIWKSTTNQVKEKALTVIGNF